MNSQKTSNLEQCARRFWATAENSDRSARQHPACKVLVDFAVEDWGKAEAAMIAATYFLPDDEHEEAFALADIAMARQAEIRRIGQEASWLKRLQ